MSVFGKIFDRIFNRNKPEAQATQTAGTSATAQTTGAPQGTGTNSPTTSTMGAGPATAAGAQPAQNVDVEAVLTQLASSKGEKLNWRSSIVDLMKLLDLDSSLQERKELATELGYSGAKDGSAEMNLWLHKAVMKKLAANGGKVPADLQD